MAFEKSPQLQLEVTYFRDNITNVTSAEDLVTDRRLLGVVLGAYGLSDEIDKRAFLRKILDDGTTSDKALSNRLTDTRYKDFAKALPFGDGDVVFTDTLVDKIVQQYKNDAFERALGDVDPDARLALYFQNSISDLVTEEATDRTNWFRILGSLPAREVITTALGLPDEIAQVDLDVQVVAYRAKMKEIFGGDGGPAMLTETATIEEVIRRFTIRRGIDNGPSATTPGYAALSVLQASGNGLGTGASINLFLSNG